MFQRASEMIVDVTPTDTAGRTARFSDGTGSDNLGVALKITLMNHKSAPATESVGPIGSVVVRVGLTVAIQENRWLRI